MDKLKQLVKSVSANDGVRRVVHTFVQAFVAALLISAAGVHDLSTAKAALLAAVAAGIAATKAAVVARG